MKKIFNFVVISSVFIGGLFLNSNQIFINSSSVKNNLANVSTADEDATKVSNPDEFIAAANNDENILLTSDIDFSEITTSDQITKDPYTGTIDGNGHSISNDYLSSEDSNVTYLFNSFNGVLENIVLDDFAFFAKEFVVDENNSSQAQISNVTFENVTISDEEFSGKNFYEVNNEQSLGLFADSIIVDNSSSAINFEQISINNISFTGNTLNLYNSNSLQEEIFNVGLFTGSIGKGTIDQLAIEDILFDNNEINNYSQNQYDKKSSNDVINLGMFAGKADGLNITNSFISNVNITSNTFSFPNITMGSFIGLYENSSKKSSQFYANNLNINKNSFSQPTINNDIGSLFGSLYHNSQFNSFIIEEATLEGNYYSGLDQHDEYIIGEVYGFNDTEYFNKDNSYIVTDEINNTSEEFKYISESELIFDFWKENGFDESTWDLNNLYNSSTNADEESYGYPLLLFLNETTIPTFTLTTSFNEVPYGDSTNDKFLTFNLTLDNPDNLDISGTNKSQTVLILHSSFYDLDGQNSKTITFEDFAKTKNMENTYSYTIKIDSFVQTKEQLNNYYWIEINDEFSINYTEDNQPISSNSNIINFDTENSFLTSIEPQKPEYDTNQNFNLVLTTTYNSETNELTFDLSDEGEYAYDFYYNLNLTLSSSTETYDFNLNTNNSSETIKLDENLPKRLAEGKLINDFYTVGITTSVEPTNSSYVVYLDETGKLQGKYITNISNQPSKNISETVYINGDLTNTNSPDTLENINDIVEPPVEPQETNESTIISISILLVLFVLVVLIYLFVHFKNRRKSISDSE